MLKFSVDFRLGKHSTARGMINGSGLLPDAPKAAFFPGLSVCPHVCLSEQRSAKINSYPHQRKEDMKPRKKPSALAIAFCCALAFLTHATAAVESLPSASRQAFLQAQLLLKERNEARPMAKAAEKKLREAGLEPESLGFEAARALRDRHGLAGSQLAAYDRYVKTANELEKKIQDEVQRGVRPVICQDIARFERLQAKVDLARISGRLPAQEE